MKNTMPYFTDIILQAKKTIQNSQNISALESVRVKYFGKKGFFTKKMKELRNLTPEERPVVGKRINQAKQEVQRTIADRKAILELTELNSRLTSEILDVTLPGRRMENGCLHPISHTIECIEHFFLKLGFSIVTGPEVEDDYHNFDALNTPMNHPSRTDHDTFRFSTTKLLRTQTSGVQIRIMNGQQPPIRIISSGRVYRNDHNQTHTPMFHQMEGLIIDTNISFSNLKGTLNSFLYNFFEADSQIRYRPSYFPFTEPSAEIDIMGRDGRWLEVLGCGMVHPKVLHNVGINPENYSGFAFGIGIERLAMLRYNVIDLRTFFENDLRFLQQFK